MQETEDEQECRTEFTQSCNTVYDTRQQCSTKYEEECQAGSPAKFRNKPVSCFIRTIQELFAEFGLLESASLKS